MLYIYVNPKFTNWENNLYNNNIKIYVIIIYGNFIVFIITGLKFIFVYHELWFIYIIIWF